MVKIILCVFIFFSTMIAIEKQDTNNEFIGFGGSFGVMSEKIPPTFFELTSFYIPNNNTEIFATLSTVIFGGGIGIGAKYYLRDRKKTSPFISCGYSASILGDGLERFVGPHIAAGISISFAAFLNRIVSNENFIISINLGGGHVFYDDIWEKEGNGWYPILNLQSNIVFSF